MKRFSAPGRTVSCPRSGVFTAPAKDRVSCYNVAMTDQSELSEATERLKVLAHPDRLHIAACLLEGSHTAAELAQTTRKSVDVVMEHLTVMTTAGFIECDGVGPYGMYSFRTDVSLSALEMGGDAKIDFGCCQLTLTQLKDMKPRS